MDGLQYALHSRFDAGEGDRVKSIRVQEEARCFRRGDAAPQKSLCDQWMQVELREGAGDLNSMGIQPASHPSSIACPVPGVKPRTAQTQAIGLFFSGQ